MARYGILILLLLSSVAQAHWLGPPQDPKLHDWFESLSSGKGPCCSFADGLTIGDVDWDTNKVCDAAKGTDQSICHIIYRVQLNGVWIPVPNNAVVEEPNRFGPAVVWPYQGTDGTTQIRCFLPGAEG